MRKIVTAFLLWIVGWQTSALGEIVVASGGQVPLQSLGAFDQVCHSLGPMTVNVTQQPIGGTVIVKRTMDYPNFSTINGRSRCNTARRPTTRVIYQSSPGYVGTDQIGIEWIGPMGRAWRTLYTVSVRPRA